MLAALWMNPKSTLRYGMIENVPSEQARSALTELVEAGLVSHRAEVGGAVVYALTPAGVAMDRRKSLAFVKAHGSFPLSVPKVSP